MNISQENGGAPVVRSLVVETGGDRGMVQIEPRHSLHDVRHLIQEEFDDEMIPQPDFYFMLDDVRIGRKQEARYKAMQFLDRNVKLLPVTTTKAPSQPAATKRPADANDLSQTPAKKTCPATVAITVTPKEESCPTPEAQEEELQESKKPAARPLMPACGSEEEVEYNGGRGDDYGFMDENGVKSEGEDVTTVHEDDKDVGAHGDSSSRATESLSARINENGYHSDVKEDFASGNQSDSHEKYNQAVQQSRSVLAHTL
jgi:hypothetical protein